MKTITIGGKDYKVEYSIEASLYPDLTGALMDSLISIGVGKGAAESNDTTTVFETMKSTVSNMPVKALTLFHAGLLEHHDLSFDESKELFKQYIKESKKSAYDVFSELMTEVNNDNFFEMIGLDEMFPTDEKKKTRKSKNSTEVGENTSTEE